MDSERFSAYQFFPDGSYEQVRRGVDFEEIQRAALHYSTCVGARIGTTVRVIVTDDGDSIVWEWIFGKGVVFPPPAEKV